jgi:hypothetical protein
MLHLVQAVRLSPPLNPRSAGISRCVRQRAQSHGRLVSASHIRRPSRHVLAPPAHVTRRCSGQFRISGATPQRFNSLKLRNDFEMQSADSCMLLYCLMGCRHPSRDTLKPQLSPSSQAKCLEIPFSLRCHHYKGATTIYVVFADSSIVQKAFNLA